MAVELTYDGTLREISIDAGVLRYHEACEGTPLLLLHGSGPGVTGWRNFRGILGTFAAHFRCLILEFPGFGVSDDFGGHPMVTAQGALGTFAEALGLDSIDIIGNSMGVAVSASIMRSVNPPRFDAWSQSAESVRTSSRPVLARASGSCRSSPRTRPASG